MNTYIAIYRIPVATLQEWKKTTSPEEMEKQSKEMMSEMDAWMEKHADSFLDKGKPLGKTKTVSASGILDSQNDMTYLQIVQAESHKAAANIFEDCPHIQIPDSSIDVMEVPRMGM